MLPLFDNKPLFDSKRVLLSLLGFSMGLTGMVSSHAVAQSNERVIDSIIVTAQKREESLQDVPISISAFDAEALEVRDIQGFEDISEFTPGFFTYPAAANAAGLRLSIRGVGTIDPQHGLDSKVALYQDGMYLGKVIGLAFDSPDIERVEVLKGPQGTLYGRNSVAGAVNLISAKPSTDEMFGRAQIGYGTYTKKISGLVNIPISETQAIRFSASYEDDEGWVENAGLGENFAASERYGARLSYLNEISDDLTLNVTADYTETKSTPLYYQTQPGQSCTAYTDPYLTCSSPAALAAAVNSDYTSFERLSVANTAHTVYPGSLEQYGIMANLEYDYADNHSVKLLTGYRFQDGQRAVALAPNVNLAFLRGTLASFTPNLLVINALVADSFVTPERLADFNAALANHAANAEGLFYTSEGGSVGPDEHEQNSTELTFTGDFIDGRLEYTAGLYYFSEDTATTRELNRSMPRNIDASQYVSSLAAVLTGFGTTAERVRAGIAANIPEQTPDRDNVIENQFQIQFPLALAGYANLLEGTRNASAAPIIINTVAYAAYANATYHVADDLRVTVGLRYSEEERDGLQQPVSTFFEDTFSILGNEISLNDATVEFDSTDPSLIVEYDVNDELMVYASRSEAFRSGGFNASATSPAAEGEAYGEDFVFGPEEITAYEVGFKSDLLNNRLRVNGAAYFYELTSEQFNIPRVKALSTQRSIVNSSSDLYGVEFDIVALLGDRYTVSANYSYTSGDADPIFNPYLCTEIRDGQAVDVDCSRPTFVSRAGLTQTEGYLDQRPDIRATPEHALSASLDYVDELANGVGLRAHIDYNWKSEVVISPNLFSDDRHVVNANVRFDYPSANGNGTYMMFWSKNLFDESYRIEGLDFSSFAYSTAVYGEPRTFGVTVGMNF